MTCVFSIVYRLLAWLSKATGLSSNEVNVITYYIIVPAVFFYLIDRIMQRHSCAALFLASWGVLLLLIEDFRRFCDRVFVESATFLEGFDCIGWDYTVASVMICVIFPGMLSVGLFYYAFPKLFERKPLLSGQRSDQ